jgi:hypothetical protein
MAPASCRYICNRLVGAFDQEQQPTEDDAIVPLAITAQRVDSSHERRVTEAIDHNAGRLAESV